MNPNFKSPFRNMVNKSPDRDHDHHPKLRHYPLFKTPMSHRNFSENRIDRVFTSPTEAVTYYDFLLLNGYLKSDIDVLMSQDIWERFFAINGGNSSMSALNTKDKAIREDNDSGARSGIASAIVHPNLGLAIAGPVAGVLASSAGKDRNLLKTFIRTGLSETTAEAYTNALKNGSIIVSAESKNLDGPLNDLPYGEKL